MGLDFRNTKEVKFLKDAGIYDVKITGVEEDQSSAGNDMWVIAMETPDGKQCKRYVVFTEKTMPYLKHDFRILGFNVDEDIIDANDLIGKELKIEAKHQMEIKKDAFGNVIGKEKSEYLNIEFYEDKE